jgi:putative hydrolase of the HAD superfamily
VPAGRLSETTDQLVGAFRRDYGWWHIIPGRCEALARLAQHAPIAVISNGSGEAQDALRRLGVCQVGAGPGVEVRAIVDSAAVGVGKPDPRIFQIALDHLGVAASHALHVGDTLRTDIDGAVRAGIRPFHIAPYGCAESDGDHVDICHLEEVATAVCGA